MNFSGGTGTADDPYLIANETHLNNIRSQPAASYRLAVDIVLTGLWTPIASFSGSLDGASHSISGLQVDYSGGHGGFFSSIAGARITDLELATAGVGVRGVGAFYKAVLAGIASSGCTISRVVVRGLVDTGGSRAGGFIGYTDGSNSRVTESAALVKLQGSLGFSSSDVGNGGGSWTYLDCITSPGFSGAPAGRFTGVPGATLPPRSSYPGSWNFNRVWELVDGYPTLRPIGSPNQGFNYALLTTDDQTVIEGAVKVDGLAAARRILALTEDPVVVAGPSGNQLMQVVVGQGVTSDEGTVEIDLGGYARAVWLLALDDWGVLFSPGTDYEFGAVVRPTGVFNGRVYVCVSAGAAAEEPVWWDEGVRSVGAASFEARLYHRPLAHGPYLPRVKP